MAKDIIINVAPFPHKANGWNQAGDVSGGGHLAGVSPTSGTNLMEWGLGRFVPLWIVEPSTVYIKSIELFFYYNATVAGTLEFNSYDIERVNDPDASPIFTTSTSTWNNLGTNTESITLLVGDTVLATSHQTFNLTGVTNSANVTFQGARLIFTDTAPVTTEEITVASDTTILVTTKVNDSWVNVHKLLAYYPLDTNTNDTSLSNGNFDLTADPYSYTTGSEGKLDEAVIGNRLDGGVPPPPYGIFQKFTFAIWAKSEVADQAAYMFDYFNNQSPYLNHVRFYTSGPSNNKVVMDMRLGTAQVFNDTFDTDTNWHHWAASYDGSNIRWFRDGVFLSQDSVSGDLDFSEYTGSQGGAHFGGQSFSGATEWEGLLDEFRIYKYALSDKEIYDLYLLEDTSSLQSDTTIFNAGWDTIEPLSDTSILVLDNEFTKLSDSAIFQAGWNTIDVTSDTTIFNAGWDTIEPLSDTRIKILGKFVKIIIPLTNENFETGAHGNTPPTGWDAGNGSQDNNSYFIKSGSLGVRLALGSNPYSAAYIEQNVFFAVSNMVDMTLWLKSANLTQQTVFTYTDDTTTTINHGAVSSTWTQKTILNSALTSGKTVKKIKIESIGSGAPNVAALDDIVLTILTGILSNTRIFVPDNELTTVSDTSILIPDNEFTKLSDTSILDIFEVLITSNSSILDTFETTSITTDSAISDTFEVSIVADTAVYQAGWDTKNVLSDTSITDTFKLIFISDSTVQHIRERSRVSNTTIYGHGYEVLYNDTDPIISNSAIYREGFNDIQIISNIDIQRTFKELSISRSSIKDIFEVTLIISDSTIYNFGYEVVHDPLGDADPFISDSRIVSEGTYIIPSIESDARIKRTFEAVYDPLAAAEPITSDTWIAWIWGPEVLHDPEGTPEFITADSTIFNAGYGDVTVNSKTAILRTSYGNKTKSSDTAIHKSDIEISNLSDTRIFRPGGYRYPYQQQNKISNTSIKETNQTNVRGWSRIKLLGNEFTKLSDSFINMNLGFTKISNTSIKIFDNKKVTLSDTKIKGVWDILKLSNTVIKIFGLDISPVSDTLIHRDPTDIVFSDSRIKVIFIRSRTSNTYVIHEGTNIVKNSDTTIFNTSYGNIEKSSLVRIKNLEHKTITLSDTAVQVTATTFALSDTSIRRDRSNIGVIFEKGRQL